MDDPTKITVSKAFYHYHWCVKFNKRNIGSFLPSEVINPYQSKLCFDTGGNKFSSEDLRVIAGHLDELNSLGSEQLNKM